MYLHVAIFKWKSNVEEQDVKDALRGVESLQDKIPGIVEITCGKNYSPYGEGYTHIVVVRGDTQQAIDAYRKHPDHVIVAKKIDAMEEHGVGVDFVTGRY